MLYRSMTPAADELPTEGTSRRALGVVIPGDVTPDAEGRVHWGGGGLSATPCTMWKLPPHRRPRAMGGGSTGKNTDYVFSIAFEAIRAVGLAIRPDPERPTLHALVEPIESLDVEAYRRAIARTRARWTKAWP